MMPGRRAILVGTCATALAVAWRGALAADLVPLAQPALAASVRFDAVYIAALAMSSSAVGDASLGRRAQGATNRLHDRWPQLRSDLAAAWPRSGTWSAALREVDGLIAEATRAAKSGDWHATHEALEDVRVVMRRARVALGADYFVDRLTAFHAPMETLALAAANPAAGGLTPDRRSELFAAVEVARSSWEPVMNFPIDAADYGLAPAREAHLRQGLAGVQRALDALRAAVAARDDAALLRAAGALKPPFAQVFKLFAMQEDGPQ